MCKTVHIALVPVAERSRSAVEGRASVSPSSAKSSPLLSFYSPSPTSTGAMPPQSLTAVDDGPAHDDVIGNGARGTGTARGAPGTSRSRSVGHRSSGTADADDKEARWRDRDGVRDRDRSGGGRQRDKERDRERERDTSRGPVSKARLRSTVPSLRDRDAPLSPTGMAEPDTTRVSSGTFLYQLNGEPPVFTGGHAFWTVYVITVACVNAHVFRHGDF